jgi:hypothetical protein
MFTVIQTIRTYNRRGDVIRTDAAEVFASEDVLATVRYRYANARGGHIVDANDARSISLSTERDGQRIDFSEMFRLVEGDEAYNAVLEERAPAVAEETWIASKAAA